MRYLPTAKGFHARHSHFFLTLNSYFLVLITIFAYPSTLNLYYMQHLDEYINEIGNLYATGMAREHSYRPALEKLLNALLPGLKAINEPARIACGAPDYIIIRESDSQPVAFVEAKDIGDNDLDGRKQHREQFNRYKSSLNHIVFTDYLDFHLYEYGEPTACVRIAETTGDKIVAVKGNEAKFAALINRLAEAQMQSITSAGRLAVQMAAKARLLAETIKAALGDTDENIDNQQLRGQFDAFKSVLIHDITPEGFADVYAQTIAYGMFAARLHDDTPQTFSRQEAATLIPKTNPFLRKIFQSIAGYDLDERIAWIVDDLAATFRATDMARIMRDYTNDRRHDDPMIHFYEDFLSAYDPKLRKARGVWYTPQAVVSFIVRGVDSILQRDFNLPLGLADYSTVERQVKNEQYTKGHGGKPTYRKTFHRVQILDPATGTGTFLAEVVNRIHDKFKGMEGMWQSYVEDHLLARLNGFELLMASYAIAHLKLDMLLQATGYTHKRESRLRVYLTNSLEECHPDTGSLFAQWLSAEANYANRIKRDTPVMVMIGNPPYSGESKNKGEWIMGLMEDYKKEPGGKETLNERNPKWINDDYVKFIRMAQYFIEKNGEGIIAFINPHGYLDNPTFRGMRWNLLRTFDKIIAVNLHGNSKKKETCPDGSKDENVFDIMQGVSINFFIKTNAKSKNALGRVYYYDLYGKRQDKYSFLEQKALTDIQFIELQPQAPMYFFVPKDFSVEKEYNEGFGVNELFVENSVGIVTTKDSFLICDTEEDVEKRITDLIKLPAEELRRIYGLKDTRDWSIDRAKKDVGKVFDSSKVAPINYRPFDTKFLYYTGTTNGVVAWPRRHSMRHLLIPANLGLITCRQSTNNEWALVSITKSIFTRHGIKAKNERGYVDDCRVSNKTKERGYCFPLYVSGVAGKFFEVSKATPNFHPETLNKIEKSLGEKVEPLELFDYIYAVLHNPAYRKRYAEFLKIDFPRIPYPANAALYHSLAEKGGELRRLHLMGNSDTWELTTTYPETGTNEVTELTYSNGRVYINPKQYFGNVSETAWTFFIGGYQPAQKWLKDRKGHTLSFADIRHYQKIIAALDGTQRIMAEINEIQPFN